MLELVTITGIRPYGLANGRDHGLAIGRPDDDGVDLLLDQILDLGDLAGDVAAGVKHDASTLSFASAAAMKAFS
jgi:hypothetical protein